MIATCIKLIFVAAILLTQPSQRDYDRADVGNGAIATSSNHVPRQSLRRVRRNLFPAA